VIDRAFNPRETSRERADLLAPEPTFEVVVDMRPSKTVDDLLYEAQLRDVQRAEPEMHALLRLGVERRHGAITRWQEATAWHPNEDGRVTFADVARVRRAFQAAGWRVRVEWDEQGFDLKLFIAPRDGYNAPAWPSSAEVSGSASRIDEQLERQRSAHPELEEYDGEAEAREAQDRAEQEAP
jgi:hypothetical protein